MTPAVAAFTDTYLPSVNGVTYTIRSWRDRWRRRGGRMDVVYPRSAGYDPEDGEFPVRSLPFPWYDDFRLGLPATPSGLGPADVVHVHGPFALGLAGLRFARKVDAPVVASYHTPTSQYAEYLAPTDRTARAVTRAAEAYERWFFDRVDLLLAPSDRTLRYVTDEVGVDTPGTTVPNGVDVEFFRPDAAAARAFRARHDLPADRPLVGYTGRHGYEKDLFDLVEAAAGLDATLVFGGDGPAREELAERAADLALDARFLGFLDREALPSFYAALDAFAFPSPVETQGLVALEAMACGTPVVGVDAGALAETVDDGETGYHYPQGDVAAFRAAIGRALDDRVRLSEACLDRREAVSIDAAVDALAGAYDRVL